MKHETPIIQASTRERCGSRYAQRLRKQGRLPAVIYGHKSNPVAISVDQGTMLRLLKHGAHAVYVDVDGERETCLVKDLQYGYLGDNIIHVDFSRVDLDEVVSVRVHLAFVGTPAAANKADAILQHDHTDIGVRCKVSEIPEEIKVDLSRMDGTQLSAAEVPLPKGLELDEDPHTLVASVSFLRAAAEPVGEEVEVATEGAEPEVISESKADAGGDES